MVFALATRVCQKVLKGSDSLPFLSYLTCKLLLSIQHEFNLISHQMKIQEVKKECVAIVGLSVEFSNSEISSLSSLLSKVSDAIEKGIETNKLRAETTKELYDEKKDIPVVIDLKSLKRIEWLLTQLTKDDNSGLFNVADADYRSDVGFINNIKVAASLQ